MAVYTQVDDAELLAFLATYDIGDLLSCKGIAEGVENSNYYLHTSAGSFILTLYERRVAEADLPFFLGLMEHLARRGVTCPQPVPNRAGEPLGRLAGRPAVIVTFLDGYSVHRPEVAHCAALGAALAQLHLAGADFPLRRLNALSLGAWRPLFAPSAVHADEVEPGLRETVEAELDYLEQNWPRDLPSGVIHADLFPDNAFFLGDKMSGVIDFYFACNDAYAYDLAICLNAWCFDEAHRFEMEKGAALLSAYRRVRPLDDAELDAFPTLARGAAMRFLLTRYVDWLNVPKGALVRPKDPREYLAKLRFHQTAGAFL
ncbi:homoserine kinase [Methylocystis sp. MJC1]|jgi:homoserine kinase type II|uniref:homoserine kinase n=1 Tax=Methylocystis sp. MJC1 TaxID=2654282 RepID=UPI0013EB4E49|nr:homoserine kinase [Methylocystis sp. MJC1]KAF2992475.1 Homoserine kinase [Methylocystis sp. MJC1]MBU6526453.1 homoserine kinase [Methylocystis sp. MJC1]UZX12895.1 homoserine kinase [Methylocystis sp. MJC1]